MYNSLLTCVKFKNLLNLCVNVTRYFKKKLNRRVKRWRPEFRESLSVSPRFLWECLTSFALLQVSISCHVKPYVRFSRIRLTYLLHIFSYMLSNGSAFRQRYLILKSLYTPLLLIISFVLHLFHPNPWRCFALMRCILMRFSIHLLMYAKHLAEFPILK